MKDERLSSDGSVGEKNLQIDMEKLEGLSQISDRKVEKLSIMETTLALVAANIGGGILGMPYAYYHLGLFLASILTLVMAMLSQMSTMLHLKTKDLTPRKYESIYEIAYLLVGRASIFVVTTIMFSSVFGCIIMYYIIIGETLSSFCVQALVAPGDKENLDQYPW